MVLENTINLRKPALLYYLEIKNPTLNKTSPISKDIYPLLQQWSSGCARCSSAPPWLITDVIIVEAKLTDDSPYTPAQILKFTDVKQASDAAKIPFELKFTNEDIGQVGYVLDVPKNNVVSITAKNIDDILAESIGLHNIDLIKNLIIE